MPLGSGVYIANFEHRFFSPLTVPFQIIKSVLISNYFN